MATRGEWFATKAAAQKKAKSLRKKGYKAYTRKALMAKPGAKLPVTHRRDQRLGWLVSW